MGFEYIFFNLVGSVAYVTSCDERMAVVSYPEQAKIELNIYHLPHL